jgi:hypothetical protein
LVETGHFYFGCTAAEKTVETQPKIAYDKKASFQFLVFIACF